MYDIIYETSLQSRFDARYWMLGAGALGQCCGMVWGGRWGGGQRRMKAWGKSRVGVMLDMPAYKKNILLDEQGQLHDCLGLGSRWS